MKLLKHRIMIILINSRYIQIPKVEENKKASSSSIK